MTTEPFRHQIQLAAPPDKVFPYLTHSELMPTWMGDYAALDPRPGGQFSVDINGIPVRGRFLEVDPPRRLVLTWGHAGSGSLPPGSTTVEITLTPTGAGTLLTVEHRDLPPEHVGEHAIGWPHFLARLAVAATDGNPGPDPFATQPPDSPAESRQESAYKRTPQHVRAPPRFPRPRRPRASRFSISSATSAVGGSHRRMTPRTGWTGAG